MDADLVGVEPVGRDWMDWKPEYLRKWVWRRGVEKGRSERDLWGE